MSSRHVTDQMKHLMSALSPCPVQVPWWVDTACVLVRVDRVSTSNRDVDSNQLVPPSSLKPQGDR
jgi:hypothetical protein